MPEFLGAQSRVFLHHAAIIFGGLFVLTVSGCQQEWNNPYPASLRNENIQFSAFTERPKHLDPVRSYASNEYRFIGQIYEPPLQYHYLKRPYELIPLTATQMPTVEYFDKNGQKLTNNVETQAIAHSVYEIHIRPGTHYQPHPAFALDDAGERRYSRLSEADLENINTLGDFAATGSRELVAADYVYQIKRLAHPRVNSPIQGLMSEHIVGLREYAKALKEVDGALRQAGKGEQWFDLRQYPLAGVEVVDRYTYRIKIKGKYPQLLFWLAMPFFSPMPWEADQLYAEPGMKERNITLDWYPVGTGAYMLAVNNPNRQMVMVRNPNFRGAYFPAEGEPSDEAAGFLKDAGRPIPFIDKVIYSLEKEQIPYWNKFLQGYYDLSGISSDSFDQAIQFTNQGDVGLSPLMQAKDIQLQTAVQSTTFFMGFNMLNETVGGDSERTRLLRRAISIAVNYEEYISIFANGRGVPAQSIIPPGIFGHAMGEEGINPYVYDWVDNAPRRKPVSEAKKLLRQAGYPNGRDSKTGKPLLINLDITGGGSEDKALFDWLRKQFRNIDLELVIRNTDYNRFQDKMRKGNTELFMLGWNADYPDPENFLFLLYGPNGKVKFHGENSSNYQNKEFDQLFDKMKNIANSPQRLAVIDQMIEISRRDAPLVWGFHPKQFVLHHGWMHNVKPHQMAHNTLMYKRVDPALRVAKWQKWNQPVTWPVITLLSILLVSMVPAVLAYRRKEQQSSK